MAVLVHEAPREHYGWIAERAQLSMSPHFYALEAVEGERILGMVGYDGWTPGAVALHIALDSPIALRHLLRPGFGLAFDDPPRGFGRGVAIATVLSTNRASLLLVEHLGFREVMRGRGWWSKDVDLVWHEMRREDCRFIRQPQQIRRVA